MAVLQIRLKEAWTFFKSVCTFLIVFTEILFNNKTPLLKTPMLFRKHPCLSNGALGSKSLKQLLVVGLFLCLLFLLCGDMSPITAVPYTNNLWNVSDFLEREVLIQRDQVSTKTPHPWMWTTNDLPETVPENLWAPVTTKEGLGENAGLRWFGLVLKIGPTYRILAPRSAIDTNVAKSKAVNYKEKKL